MQNPPLSILWQAAVFHPDSMPQCHAAARCSRTQGSRFQQLNVKQKLKPVHLVSFRAGNSY